MIPHAFIIDFYRGSFNYDPAELVEWVIENGGVALTWDWIDPAHPSARYTRPLLIFGFEDTGAVAFKLRWHEELSEIFLSYYWYMASVELSLGKVEVSFG